MEYFRGISNPIGIKISDKSDGEGVVSLVKTLNPDNIPGRITLVSRMGAAKLREHLPRLISAIEDAGLNALWVQFGSDAETPPRRTTATRRVRSRPCETRSWHSSRCMRRWARTRVGFTK